MPWADRPGFLLESDGVSRWYYLGINRQNFYGDVDVGGNFSADCFLAPKMQDTVDTTKAVQLDLSGITTEATAWNVLTPGADGTVLTSSGASQNLSWEAVAASDTPASFGGDGSDGDITVAASAQIPSNCTNHEDVTVNVGQNWYCEAGDNPYGSG
jgi:hypothetical protein